MQIVVEAIVQQEQQWTMRNDPVLPCNLSVFGVPIEATVQREQSGKAVPLMLVRCADYLVISGEGWKLHRNLVSLHFKFSTEYDIWIILFS
jgi:hypothetical protein